MEMLECCQSAEVQLLKYLNSGPALKEHSSKALGKKAEDKKSRGVMMLNGEASGSGQKCAYQLHLAVFNTHHNLF